MCIFMTPTGTVRIATETNIIEFQFAYKSNSVIILQMTLHNAR